MSPDDKSLYLKIAYFTSLASASILFGFSLTLNKLRKSSPEIKTGEANLYEEGVALARKALMRGTIYAICGFGLFSFTSYELFGKKLIADFNSRAKNNDEKDIAYLQSLFNAPRSDLVGNQQQKTANKVQE